MGIAARAWRRLRTRRALRRLTKPAQNSGVVVASFRDGGSAYAAAGSLHAAGIPAFVHEAPQPYGYGGPSFGPMRVVVRPEDERAARRELGEPGPP